MRTEMETSFDDDEIDYEALEEAQIQEIFREMAPCRTRDFIAELVRREFYGYVTEPDELDETDKRIIRGYAESTTRDDGLPFALAVGVSWIAYRCIEKPFLSLKSRIGRPASS